MQTKYILPQLNKPQLCGALVLAGLLSAGSLAAQPSGQWDFTKSNLTATVGSDLQFADGAGGVTDQGTAFGTTTSFGIPDIGGTNTTVMRFPAATNGQGYLMPGPSTANGGGGLVNDYTVIFDLLYPAGSNAKLRPLLDTDQSIFVPGPDMVVDVSNGIGIRPNGPYVGSVTTNAWHRVGFSVQQDKNTIMEYIDGTRVGIYTVGGSQAGVDGRFALAVAAGSLILGTTDTNAAPGYVSSIQIRDVALGTGQMKALGGATASKIPLVIPPVPSYIDSRTPDANETGVNPLPHINIVLNEGDTIVNPMSVKLYLDKALVAATVTPTLPTVTVDFPVTTILRPLSSHQLDLVYSDSVVGLQTNTWLFSVANYQNVTLPPPIYFENFDSVAEGGIPAGWTATNWTDTITPGLDLTDPESDSYKDWVTISVSDYITAYPDTDNYLSPGFPQVSGNRRMMIPPIIENGVLLTSLASGNLLVAESDQRGQSQVQVIFTKDFDLTGYTNVFVSFHNINEQNQDNICAVEYSIDHGATWQPLLYMFDDGTTDGDGSDVVTNQATGKIDVDATFKTARTDQAHGLAYGTYIGAAITTNLIPYIRGCRNDDPVQQKRIEVIRMPLADNQPAVQLRFMQAGTGSWYFDIDNLGLYSINTPVITTQPLSQTIDANTPVTFSVVAQGSGTLTYQWEFNGQSISGATGSSYTINSVQPSDAGLYDVVVANRDGPTTSATAKLTVVTNAQILTQPISQAADVGDTITLISDYRGGRPIGSYWTLNGAPIPNSATNGIVSTLTLSSVTTNASGIYRLIITNSFGMLTSGVAQVTVVGGSITNGLVAHLTFDGNFNDTSGRGNNGAYAFNGTSGDPNPVFIPGKIGQAFEFTTLADGTKMDYATLGYPTDLQFGDSNAVSISLWVNYTNQSDDLPFISNKDWNSSGNRGWGIFAQSAGDFRVNFTGPNGGSDKLDYHPTRTLRDGNWHNVVLSIARAAGSHAGFACTYVDGVQVSTNVMVTAGSIDTGDLPFTNEQGPNGTPLATSQSTWAVNIGQDGTGVYHDQGSAYNIAGHIDDVGIWRRALSFKEANAIYTAGQAGKDLSQAVVVAIIPPSISADPVSQIVSPGANVSFSVTATGTTPFTYQWQKNGSPLGGATDSSLTLSAVAADAAGAYAAVVSNPAGSATSHVAQLVVFTGPVTQNLVAHLKFDGDYHDASGSGTDGSAVGTPSFEAGLVGQAVHVTSAGTPANNPSPNSYVTLGNPAQLKFGTNDFSIAFWAKVMSQNDDKPFIANKDWGAGGNPGWVLATEGDGMKWNFRDDQSSRRDSPHVAPQLENGSWHHVAVAFQRGISGFIYVDGQLVNSTKMAPDSGKVVGSADTTLAVNIGQDGTGLYTDDTGAAAVDMLVDDLGIWGRVITPQEAAAIYSAGQAGKDLSQATVVISRPRLSVSVSGGNITISWAGSPTVRLQQASNLSAPIWQDVPGTVGASSVTLPLSANAAFFKLVQQ